jgi:ribosomal 50S subunit-recycling heat shock protein
MIIEVNGKRIKNNRKFKVNMELKTEIKSNTINVSIVNLDETKK